jgi:hypothetical protein
MGRGLNLKIPTASVIAGLENRLAQNKLDETHNEKIEKEYPAILKKWEDSVAKQVDKLKVENVSVQGWRKIMEITYAIPKDFPDCPARDNRRVLSNYEINEIESSIRMLRMTQEEFVNASTMRSISEYL